jgi:hypothetical protein
MTFTVRCEGYRATIELSDNFDGKVGVEAASSSRLPTSMTIDLTSTDEGAWARLLAISASELAEQRQTKSREFPLSIRAKLPNVKLVSFHVKTKTKAQYTPKLGLNLTRLGTPVSWIIGPNLGAELRFPNAIFMGSDLRAQWGHSNLTDSKVFWQLVSVSGYSGYVFLLESIEIGLIGGARVGQLKLKGEPKTDGTSGRGLTGPTGGPVVGLRLGTSVTGDLRVGADLELGYHLWSVRGNNDGGARLITVDGVWASAALTVGWSF